MTATPKSSTWDEIRQASRILVRDSSRIRFLWCRRVPILGTWVDVVVGHGSWVICMRRDCIRCARVSRKSSVLSWAVGRWVHCQNCMFNCYDVWAFVCPALFIVLFVVSRKSLVVEYLVGLRSLIVNASGLACESSVVGCWECLPSSVVVRSRVG